MKRIILPILLLTISSPAFAMWGWFKRKPAPAAVAPTTEATTISGVELVKEQGEVKAELEGTPPAASAVQSEAGSAKFTFEDEPEFELPEIEKFAVTGAALARQNEMALIVAINTGDTEKVKQLIDDKKVDVKKPFKLLFYAGQTPLEVIIANDTPKKFEIAKLFLEAGADKNSLNQLLAPAIEAAKASRDMTEVTWLLELGAKDVDGKAFDLLEQMRASRLSADQPLVKEEKAVEAEAIEKRVTPIEVLKAQEIITPTETAQAEKVITPAAVETEEVAAIAPAPVVVPVVVPIATPAKPAGRLILTPLRKPAAAQPRVQEVKVEVTPKAKVILTPLRKPAAPQAKPAVQEVKVEIISKVPAVRPAAAPAKIMQAPLAAVKQPAQPAVFPPAQEGPYDSVKLARAISRGDVNTVRAALNAGVNATDTFKSLAFAGLTPLTLAFKQNVPNKLAIAELLILDGAQVADLKPFLADAIKQGNVSEVEWLLNFDVEDPDGKGAELIKNK
jgi:hypothetical protein